MYGVERRLKAPKASSTYTTRDGPNALGFIQVGSCTLKSPTLSQRMPLVHTACECGIAEAWNEPGHWSEFWDADVTHNPNVLFHDGKYYLFYMGQFGDGKNYPMHRNHQRIGVAVAEILPVRGRD